MARARAAAPSLWDGEKYKRGRAELDAMADLREMAKLGVLPAGTQAIRTAYRLVAREIDRAERAGDLYGKINAAARLAALRSQLAPIEQVATESVATDIHARLSAEIRHAS